MSKVHGNELFVGEVSELVHGDRESGVIVGFDNLQVFEPGVESEVVNILSRVGGLVLSSPGLVLLKVGFLSHLQGKLSTFSELTSELAVVD